MSDPARRTRRVIGLAFLALAILLLFAGQTVLRHELHGVRFALYWLACLLLVAMAMAVALLDFLFIRHHARRQQLHLLHSALGTPNPPRNAPANPPASKPHQNRPGNMPSAEDRAAN